MSVLIGLARAHQLLNMDKARAALGSQKETDGHTTVIELASLCGMYVFFKC